jgi:carboxypeptidase C (cathepsin A)
MAMQIESAGHMVPIDNPAGSAAAILSILDKYIKK